MAGLTLQYILHGSVLPIHAPAQPLGPVAFSLPHAKPHTSLGLKWTSHSLCFIPPPSCPYHISGTCPWTVDSPYHCSIVSYAAGSPSSPSASSARLVSVTLLVASLPSTEPTGCSAMPGDETANPRERRHAPMACSGCRRRKTRVRDNTPDAETSPRSSIVIDGDSVLGVVRQRATTMFKCRYL